MMQNLIRLLILALCLAAAAAPVQGLGQGSGQGAGQGSGQDSGQDLGGTSESVALKVDQWQAEADLIEKMITADTISDGEIDAVRATLEQQRAEIGPLIDSAKAELAPLNDQLKALGDPPAEGATEAPEIAAERKRLNDAIAQVEARVKQASQADARAAALLDRVATLRRQVFTRELLTRSASAIEPGMLGKAWTSLSDLARGLTGEVRTRLGAGPVGMPLLVRTLLPLGLLALALGVFLGIRRVALRRLLRRPADGSAGRRPATAIAVALVRLVTPALALAMLMIAASTSGLLGPQGELLLRGLAATALVVIGAYALGGAFYSPHAPQLRLSGLSEGEAGAAHRWLMGLAAILGLDRVLVVQGEKLGLAIEALAVLNTALLALGAVAVWGMTRYLAPAPPEPAPSLMAEADPLAEDDDAAAGSRPVALGPIFLRAVILLARAAALAAPALALMGYFAASRYVFYPLVFSGLVVGLGVLLFHVVQDAVETIVRPAEDEGEDDIRPSRIRLIPIAVAFLLICAALPVLALVWGADTTDLAAAWRRISEGFTIGKVVISPLDFFTFLLVFSIGYVVTRIVQGVLGRSVMPYTGLDSGAKAAISAGVGYLGIILAALVAISTTGLDLSNLAIVAGALSVGIGFGLQNVVNNFVSGVILLIERPIKTGDWVEIGGVHGTVRKVNVRSTEIQTFDRSTMFVPNADLISGTVTNWTHANLHGRLIVKVGVAYGTDTKRVEKILTEIARAHAMLLRRPEPYVLFRGFGADSLDFEIRGVLRDVNWILNVTSDINHEIARRFTEEGIEIPFAQRDLHIRNAGELGEAIGSAVGSAVGSSVGGAVRSGASAVPAPEEPAETGEETDEDDRDRAARDDPAGD